MKGNGLRTTSPRLSSAISDRLPVVARVDVFGRVGEEVERPALCGEPGDLLGRRVVVQDHERDLALLGQVELLEGPQHAVVAKRPLMVFRTISTFRRPDGTKQWYDRGVARSTALSFRYCLAERRARQCSSHERKRQ